MTKQAWQVQTAKQRFSELLRAAEAGEPQIVTRNGNEVAAVISIAEYRRLRGSRRSLADFLLSGPPYFDDLELPERRIDEPRVRFE